MKSIPHRLLLVITTFLCAPEVFAHGVSESSKEAMIEGGLLDYMWLGAEHMVTGYDHLLFLFGVMFFLKQFKDIVKFISAFTVGHCITLIVATFNGISANYYVVDAIIALTVVYKGFDNIGGFQKVFKKEAPNLLAMVFVFGLIHGFGLSTRLQQLPLGDDGLLLRILSFNVGVELGQIAALAVMLMVLSAWRKSPSFEKMSRGANVALMIAGFGLFIMQCYGFVTGGDEHDSHETEPPAITEPADSHDDHGHSGHDHSGHDHHSHDTHEHKPVEKPAPDHHSHDHHDHSGHHHDH